jgi:hypothetical protein
MVLWLAHSLRIQLGFFPIAATTIKNENKNYEYASIMATISLKTGAPQRPET